MKTNLYDIESLENVFTLCNVRKEENIADVFFLVDTPELLTDPNFEDNLTKRILEKNRNFSPKKINFYDLRFELGNRILAQFFGLSDAELINDPNSKSNFPSDFRLVCDTDPNYNDDDYPYFLNYNGANYDTTMYALYMYECYPAKFKNPPANMPPGYVTQQVTSQFQPISAKRMRMYNDDLFSPKFKPCMWKRLLTTYDAKHKLWSKDNYNSVPYLIRKNLLMTNRYIDVSLLNEKQSKVGLKRLLGMLGYQILESDKLKNKTTIETIDELYDLIAYNISDCVNLGMLFEHPYYQGQFVLKRGLLKTYPELIYEKKKDEYKPDIQPSKVSKWRLCIDSSSSQFAAKALCPYGHLKDIPTVSFMYPSENKAKELGITRVNVLDEAKKFFYAKFSQPELRARFDNVYNYYKAFEGKNFNEGKNYLEDYGDENGVLPPELRPYKPKDIPKVNTCLPYFYADGSQSTCFAVFSIGGVHGAECNLALYQYDHEVWTRQMADLNFAKLQYPNPVDLHIAKEITMPDGRVLPSSAFIKSGATKKQAEWKRFEDNEPMLFKEDSDPKKGWKLNTDYTYTSADPTNHEDFTSYYPNLLRMMEAFYNPGLGYDRYAEIFDNKQKYGKLMKDKSLPKEERDLYSVLREGTKLILNSASGAGDVAYETNIRMNNAILSMRIIGQLFSWRIGQAQTYAGAKITSTNTDGLYSVLDASINNPLLEKESADIGVEIEPEPTYLISKDSNNRLEMNPDTGEIESASGGTLGCRKGPTPTKALSHPALIDWALAEYLVVAALRAAPTLGMDLPFDDEVGRKILESAFAKTNTREEKTKFLTLAQNVIASSPGSMTYIFGINDNNENIMMQHYNRIFLVKSDVPNTVRLSSATAKALTPAMINKRRKDNERLQQHDPIALQILSANGVSLNEIPSTSEAAFSKVTNIEVEWKVLIENGDLYYLDESRLDDIIADLDIDKYLYLLRNAFTSSWMNKTPPDEIPAGIVVKPRGGGKKKKEKKEETPAVEVNTVKEPIIEEKNQPSPSEPEFATFVRTPSVSDGIEEESDKQEAYSYAEDYIRSQGTLEEIEVMDNGTLEEKMGIWKMHGLLDDEPESIVSPDSSEETEKVPSTTTDSGMYVPIDIDEPLVLTEQAVTPIVESEPSTEEPSTEDKKTYAYIASDNLEENTLENVNKAIAELSASEKLDKIKALLVDYKDNQSIILTEIDKIVNS